MTAYDTTELDRYFEGRVLYGLPMKSYNSFKTGGCADIAVFPKTAEELAFALVECRREQIPYEILGNGTNVVVSDLGVAGAVIFTTELKSVEVKGDIVSAYAGALLAETAAAAMRNGLSGMEFASGIPGTVGGGVYMNAGAYGSEIADIIIGAEIIDEAGQRRTVKPDELKLGYRHSVFQQNRDVVLSAAFRLKPAPKDEVRRLMHAYNEQRRTKQPLEYPSAGSTFKRPEGHYAAQLIERADLKGCRIGGAMVSEKHAGFIVNVDNATSGDILSLIDYVKEQVYAKFGVMLAPEVKIIGRTE